MTHTSTEQERAEFEAWAEPKFMDGTIPARNMQRAGIGYGCAVMHAVFLAWQASRRAPVVTQGWKPVPMEPTPEQLLKVYKQTGVSRKELAELWTAMLAAAPQPPRADSNSHEFDGIKPEAAPVQLPESMGVLRVFEPHENSGVVCTEASVNAGHLSHGWHLLYTDQQVRQLLADQGIKVIE